MPNTLRSTMKKSRDISNRLIIKESNGLNDKLFWNESLQSWIVIDETLAKKVLTSSYFTTDRKRKLIETMSSSASNKEVLSNFYSNWLMYMDGERHLSLRKDLQRAMRNADSQEEMLSSKVIKEILQNVNLSDKDIDVVKEISVPFTNKFLSQLFGLSVDDYKQILQTSMEAVKFLWQTNPSEEEIDLTVESIKQTENLIVRIIKENRYEDDRLFSCMLKDIDTSSLLTAIINMVIDGHEPFLSSVSSVIERYLRYPEESVSRMITNSLKYSPPFSYCARSVFRPIRMENKDLNVGDRIMIILYSLSDMSKDGDKTIGCPHANLSFGHGSHYCLGAQITTKALKAFIKEIDLLFRERSVSVTKIEFNTSFGFQSIDFLHIKVS